MDTIKHDSLWEGWNTVRKLGSGSFGTVYEIEREIFGETERAALKVISIPQNESDPEELRNMGYDDASITMHYKSYLEDIVREYTLMSKLKGNSNIVDCDDIRCTPHEDGYGWDIRIKMELLTPMLKALDRLQSDAQIIKLGTDLCQALSVCRKRNIIHRDIKPQNIFCSENGDFKLGDFGIAKTAEKTSGGTKTGTYNYMAPEVYNNQPYGAAADIYSLGLVLYWLLNERRMPFMPLPPQMPTPHLEEQARYRRFRGEPVPPPANGSDALKQVVMKACAFDMAARFATPEEFSAALQNAANAPVAQSAPRTPVQAMPADDEGTVGVWFKPRAAEAAPQPPEEATVRQQPMPQREAVTAAPPTPRPAVQPQIPVTPRPFVPPQVPVAPRPIVRQQIPVTPRPTAQTTKKARNPLPMILGIVGAVVVLAICLIFALKPSGNSKTDTQKTQPTTTQPTTTRPTTTQDSASNVTVTFNDAYSLGDHDIWVGMDYWTEVEDGVTYVYIETAIDGQYVYNTYGELYGDDLSCCDSNGNEISYDYYGGEDVNWEYEGFILRIDDTVSEGLCTWTLDEYIMINDYEYGDYMGSAVLEFYVDRG